MSDIPRIEVTEVDKILWLKELPVCSICGEQNYSYSQYLTEKGTVASVICASCMKPPTDEAFKTSVLSAVATTADKE